MSKPSPNSYPVYFQRYIDQVPEEDLFIAFKNQAPIIRDFLATITEEKSFHFYAADKWTLKELLQHMIDTERVFNYRALSFARKEKASLPGFEENAYAASSNANSRTWQSMLDEFIIVRESTTLLFNSFSEEALQTSGIANDHHTSVMAVGFILLGHFYHHKKVIEERYLP